MTNFDNHTEAEREIMRKYHDAVDKEIYDFVQDVLNGRDTVPITVGFVTEEMGKRITELTGLSVDGNRIVLDADAVRHILKRHGEQGIADHSMQDINDIARLSYVLANYDDIEWDGGVSGHFLTKEGKMAPQLTVSKRVDGTYYIIEVVSDSKKGRNYIATAYLKKATE